MLYCAQNTEIMIPPLCFNAVGWSRQCLIDFTGFNQCCNVANIAVPFFPFLTGISCRRYKSAVLQQALTFQH